MKIILKSIYISPMLLTVPERGSVKGEIQFDKGLTIEFSEDLLPEELEYIRDGLGDLTERVMQRVLDAIRALDEPKLPAKKRGKAK